MTTSVHPRTYSGNNNSDLRIQLDKKQKKNIDNDGSNSPIASLVTQVSRTPVQQQPRVASPAYTPNVYATPVAGSEPASTPNHIDTTKKVTYYTNKTSDEDALDLSAIQFSVPTPQTPSVQSKSPVVAKTQQSPTTPTTTAHHQSVKKNKLLNYLLKSISWCFSTSTQPPTAQVKLDENDEQVEEVEETTVTTKTVIRKTSKSKEETGDQVEVEEEQSWSSKRLTTTKKKKPTSPTTKSPSTPTAEVAAPRVPVKTSQKHLLGEQPERVRGKKCLVLDLDETLVHSCFQPVPNPDFILPIEIEGTRHMVYVLKRPFVDDFLLEMSKVYEIVVFTASLSKYANPLLDQLDKHNVITGRLFREHCTYIDSCYIKDLTRLGRDISQTLIIDNSPTCYALQPQNAMAVSTWFDDKKDTQLQQMIPWLVKMGSQKDVYETLQEYRLYYSNATQWGAQQNW